MNCRTMLKSAAYSQLMLARFLISGGILSFLLGCTAATAQISADETVSTQVERANGVAEITGGTTKGNNLFHSFREFSVPQGSTAFFNNAEGIGNIISRVTGGAASNIDGLIRANGSANLILLNPSGIDFGANARLDIGGSFLGSTAESLVFADGTVFGANNTNVAPLLTVSAPVGLQLGQKSAAIAVAGTGHDFSLETPVFSHLTRGDMAGLEIKPGRALTLIGNGVSLQGGILTVESGDVGIGSVSKGIVGLEMGDRGWTLDYSDVALYNDLNLEQKAAIDTSGGQNGSVELQGRQISLENGSVVLSQNFGSAAGGDITVNATESLTVVGAEPEGIIASGLYSETLGDVSGADIDLATGQLIIEAGASIISTTSGTASGGKVNIDASESMRFVGYSTLNPSLLSVVSVQTFGSGKAGDIAVSTKNFTAIDGANISSVTGSPQGTGSGGNISVTSESIELSGASQSNFAPSQITAGSGSPGDAGNVRIDTSSLTIKNGARVDASATASGNAGNIDIAAAESIEVEGTSPSSTIEDNPSLITASANILDPALRSLFGLPDFPSGNSGSITLDTPRLQIADRGQVTVRNEGAGDAGNLSVTAQTIDLRSEGAITAAVEQGTGGTIELKVADSLNLTDEGQIVSDNSGTENGGEIEISANSLNISDRAFISTTTFGSGTGSNITLDIAETINLTGTGFEEFQQTFQLNSLDGSLKAGTRGTGIFMDTAADGKSGTLKLDARSLSLKEGAIISSPIFTDGIGGNIEIVTDNLEAVGSAVQITAGVKSTSSAAAGNIEINTSNLSLEGGATIANVTFGDAAGGNITIDASRSIALLDSPDNSIIFSGIYSSTGRGTGDSGTITLTTDDLFIEDGLISSNSGVFIRNGAVGFAGQGAGGDIAIDVADTIEISGSPADPRFVSGINSSAFAQGAAGDIKILTDKLTIRDGLQIAATATGSGNGGNLTIDASSIKLFGITTPNNTELGGLIAASGRGTFNQPPGSGSSGNIKITAESLSVENGASVDVQSLGKGSAGNLDIEVGDTIALDNRGTISAATNAGTGGDINLKADNIFWLGRSTTTATARGTANGGNIDLQANNLVVLEGSKLTADASAGRGGNINIKTSGLFVCESCQVSASSELGIDGVVNIDTLNPNPNLEAVNVPIQLAQPEEAVVLACSATANNPSSLTIGGRGGLAPRPSEVLNSRAIAEFESVPVKTEQAAVKAQLPAPARSWYVNRQGAVVLTARPNASTPQFNSPDCHVDRHPH